MLATTEIAYQARPQFIPFHKRTQRFACLVCHRRAGKTVACVHDLLDGALRCEKVRPRFAYVAPFRHQAKTVAWDYLRAAVLPLRDLGASVNESELRVDLHNGGQVRLFGADNPDALRGAYWDGVIFDEFADMDPGVQEAVQPALIDRKGWAVWIGTPRGHNAFYDIYRKSLGYDQDGKLNYILAESWYSLLLKASDSKLLSDDALKRELENLGENKYRQEYECDFEAAIRGSYYGRIIEALANGGDGGKSQICAVPYDHAAQVWTAWDLGYRDATAVWFAQFIGKEIHLIDFYRSVNATVEDDVRAVLGKPYNYAGHILPHDAYGTVKQTGQTTAVLREGLGLRNTHRCPNHRREDGISRVQITLPRCWFDKERTAEGCEHLKLYRAEFDDRLKVFKREPLHDYTSDAADAFRYLCVAADGLKGASSFQRKIVYPRSGVA